LGNEERSALKTIALFDNCRDGHHLTYLQLFSKLLLEMGYNVLTFCQQSDSLRQWMDRHAPEQADRLSVFEVEIPLAPSLPVLGTLPRTAMVLAEWRYAAQAINQAVSTANAQIDTQIDTQPDIKIDLVFFAWLDSYLSPYLPPAIIDRIFPYPWSGLYFTPPHLLHGEKLLPIIRKPISSYGLVNSPRCQGIALLHEIEAKRLKNQFNKPIVLFPDLTDETLPLTDYDVAQQIQAKSKGRLVVGLLGGLTQRKGLMTLLQVAQTTAHEDYFFVFAGRLYEHELPAEKLAQIQAFVQANPDNCLFHLARIPEESQFNAIVEACDVLFAAYENFPYSSNLITKAAVFEKPIIVSEGYCMAERVKAFNMGVIIPENDVSSCIAAIQQIKENLHHSGGSPANFAGYRQIHSVLSLRQAFAAILEPKTDLPSAAIKAPPCQSFQEQH
jgi:glycosyltransferase involved in cell wall biosynthesis